MIFRMNKPVFNSIITKTSIYLVVFLFICYGIYVIYSKKFQETIHIAVVSAKSGQDRLDGQSFFNGVNLCLKQYNQQANAYKKIVFDIYDDKNDPKNARQIAQKIVKSKALAVIGHHTSECSLAASHMYHKNNMPAITPLATHTDIDQENPRYFRTIFNNRSQSLYLTNYIQTVCKINQIFLLYDNSDYAGDLAYQLKDIFQSNGGNIIIHEIKTKNKDLESLEFKLRKNAHIPIVVASQLEAGFDIIKNLRNKGLANPLFLPDIFFTKRFIHELTAIEKNDSSFLTKEIYIISPLFFETANQSAYEFLSAYKQTYHISPDWIAAYSYDAAKVLIQVLQSHPLNFQSMKDYEARKQFGTLLSQINMPSKAIEGVTGWIYFDDHGDISHQLTMGQYREHRIIPAMIQLKPESLKNNQYLTDSSAIEKKKKQTVANIVYTHVNIKQIRNINIDQLTAFIDFEIYFHYASEWCKPHELIFLNAVQDNDIKNLKIINLKHKTKLENEIWACYEGQGSFYIDQFPGTYLFNKHIAGIQFQHKSLPASNLIYIQEKQSLENIQQKSSIIDALSGWLMTDYHSYQDYEMKTTLGNPKYLHAFGGKMGFSRFNHCILFQSSQFSLRGLVSKGLALKICFITFILLFISYFIGQWPKIMWGVITICALLFIITIESLLMYGLNSRLSYFQLQWMKNGFDIMWWFVPAFCINMFMQRFFFMSLRQKEKKNEKNQVANIVPRFVRFLIYTIACLGVVSYVFEQEISSFLATGGIFAMMIGLAVKMNVADILSGIAINIESPFRQGDWIQIDQYEGMVTDITWRSTRIKTGENAILCVPNSKATESSIQNFNITGELNWIKIQVPLSHLISPVMAEKILTAAIFATRNVMTDPIPKIYYKGTSELHAWFDIFFCIKDYSNRKRRINDVWVSIWKHLRFAEIQLSMMGKIFSFPQQKIFDILDRMDILEGINIQDKMELVPHFKRKKFTKGQIIVNHQELTSKKFYIIRKGAVHVYSPSEDGNLIEVDRMGAGDYFGETGLLGEANASQIKAVTDVTIDVISGDIFLACLDNQKPFLKRLQKLRSKRRDARKQQKNRYEKAKAEKENINDSVFLRLWGYFSRNDQN